MTDELKPCPFCGGGGAGYVDDVQYPDTPHEHVWYAVTCGKCDANGAWDLGKSGAVEKWNTRAVEDALRDELAQQAELHRMEREALIGAWNETSRQLRARIAELEARNANQANMVEIITAMLNRVDIALHDPDRSDDEKWDALDDILKAVPQSATDYVLTLECRIAELEAYLTPVKFSERKPPLVGRYLYFHKQYRRWYEEMWPYDPNKFTHWLPMPPAPEDNA